MQTPINRRAMLAATSAGLVATSLSGAEPDGKITGPMVGHLDTTSANIWFRAGKAGTFVLKLHPEDSDRVAQQITGVASVENDLCVTFHAGRLKPDTRYRYAIYAGDQMVAGGDGFHFTTPAGQATPAKTVLAFGSCADNKPLKIWSQMKQQGAQGLVLLGDTPYIDSTNLARARQRHRAFLAEPTLAALTRNTPVWGTWDDHDFAGNNTDGRVKGKENTRQAFLEYRANREAGHDGQGIYTSFRRGGVEVFLLDTRWFARTEQSPVDASKPTLLGRRQWKWLLDSLKASTAEFKIIACGMIWDDKENRESDDWGSYTHERDALFQFIGKQKISGVVLIGGDIHCSRLLRYKTTAVAGYPLHQFIVSPLHDRTIESLNVPHPDLVHGEAIPHVWLRLEVDTTVEPARLHAKWEQMNGRKMWDITLTTKQLTARG